MEQQMSDVVRMLSDVLSGDEAIAVFEKETGVVWSEEDSDSWYAAKDKWDVKVLTTLLQQYQR